MHACRPSVKTIVSDSSGGQNRRVKEVINKYKAFVPKVRYLQFILCSDNNTSISSYHRLNRLLGGRHRL